MSKTIPTDALVTVADVEQIKAEVVRGDFKRLVLELVVREPDLTIAVSERYDHILSMLERAMLTIKQRADLSKQMSLLVWLPILLMGRAHRREWDDFLPTEQAIGGPDEEGGGK